MRSHGSGARLRVMRDQPAPAALVARPSLRALRAEALPAAVDDRHGGSLGRRRERDLDLGRVLAVEAQVPEAPQAARRLPVEHLAPLVLDARRRALGDPPAGPRLRSYRG